MLNTKQRLFKELFIGTLIYAVVLGFFNDYTSFVTAKSFSTIFLSAIVLQVLTTAVFQLKNQIMAAFRDRPGFHQRALMAFCIWLVLFFSKFVFVWLIDFIFGDNIDIDGFVGILLVVASVTVLTKLADLAFMTLGDSHSADSPPKT